MRIFILMMMVAFNVFATDWSELEIGTKYKISQSFPLPQLGPSRSSIDIMAGEEFILKDVIGLDMIHVSLFQFQYLNCPGPSLKTDMEIIPVKNTTPVVEVGAQLEENCKFEVFIENKDLMTHSLFE
jgi:hypothetical protein